ncbi:MAG TPA: hypothetical protein VKM55_01605 [Candidatus Lokiarchaeia archaeon]|nr:hypothetical protein [Candidatus Lokiarchaeia archaeon]
MSSETPEETQTDSKTPVGNQTNIDIPQIILKSILYAEFNKKYWSTKAEYYNRANNYIKGFIAIFTSSSVTAGIPSALSNQSFVLLWGSLAFVALLFTIINPFLNLTEVVKQTSVLASSWEKIVNKYKKLQLETDINVQNVDFNSELIKLQEEESNINSEVLLPNDDKKLGQKLYNEILVEYGVKE